MKKLIFFTFIFCTLILHLKAQKNDVCGIYTKPITYTNQIYTHYDRFGNEYTDDELDIRLLKGFTVSDCKSGYYKLIFNNNFSDAEKAVFCQIFQELSDLIPLPKPILSGHEIPILIDISPAIKDNDPSTSPIGSAWAAGTPLYNKSCGIQTPSALQYILNEGTSKPNQYIGTILVNDTYRQSKEFHLDLNNPPTNPLHGDLYTIGMHEALHILAFSSLIGTNGTPVSGDAYSTWDQKLRSDLLNCNLIEKKASNVCCEEHALSPKITKFDNYNDCEDKIFFKTPTTNVSVSNTQSSTPVSNSYDVNNLSHLFNEKCDLNNIEEYVMFQGSGQGSRTYLSKTEKQILCDLGYPISQLGCKTDACFVVANDDGTFTSTITNSLQIPYSTLLANDIAPNLNKITPILVGKYSNNLVITTNSMNTGFIVKASLSGYYTFQYEITDCNGKCDVATITVLFVNGLLSSNCGAPQNCEYLCYGDFENFAPGTDNYFTNQNNNFLLNKYFLDGLKNTPDVKTYKNNQYLFGFRDAGSIESFYIQLTQPIEDQQEVNISFNCISDALNTKIQLFALHGNFCGGNNNLNLPTGLCQNTPIQLCPTLEGFCMGETGAFFQQLVANTVITNSSVQNIVWKNTTGHPIERILFYTYNNSNLNIQYIFDNISVKSSPNQNAITATQELIMPFVAGVKAKIKYTIKANGLLNGNTLNSVVALKANINPSNNQLSIIGNADFTSAGIANFSIQSGTTKILYLEISVAPTFVPSTYSGVVNLFVDAVTNSCNNNLGKLCETTVTNVINNNFSYEIIDFCTKKVQFTSSLSDPLLQHLWSFGDGTTSTLVNPTHQYTNFGTYNVTHQVNGSPVNPTIVTVSVGANYSIGISGNTIFFSQSILAGITSYSNKTLSISGVFILDNDCDFNNCSFIMGDGAKIEIADGIQVDFNNCRFYSCNQMWQGVVALSGSTLKMTNCSRVEDAHNAIVLNDNTSATITGNTFSKNYVNIYASNAELNSFVAHGNNHNSYKTKLKNPYVNQPIPSKWYDTYTAYWLKNVTIKSNWTAYIGEASTAISEFIDGTKNGIIAENTNLYIRNTSIKNIYPNSSYTVGSPIQGYGVHSVANVTGIKLYVRGFLNPNAVPTLFQNCNTSIYGENIILYVRNVGMTNVSNGVVGEKCPNGSSVVGCNISCSSRGVYFNQTKSGINNNTIDISGQYTSSAGIYLLNDKSSVVEDNTIKTSNVAYGIRLSDASKTWLEHNNVYILSSRYNAKVKSWFTDGIHLTNSNNCNFIENNIIGESGQGNDPLVSPETVGIFTQNSSTNGFCCNIRFF